MELKCEIESSEDVVVVNCSGRMVRGAALDQFQRQMERLNPIRLLMLDLSQIEQVDAAGLGTLLRVRRVVIEKAGKVELVNPPAFFREMLEATNLSSAFEISSLRDVIAILGTGDCARQYAGV